MSWGAAVIIATRSGLDGLEILTRLGRDFPFLSRWALEWHPPPYTMCAVSVSLGVKRPRRGVDHLLTSGAEVRERLDLYPTSSPSLSLHGLF